MKTNPTPVPEKEEWEIPNCYKAKKGQGDCEHFYGLPKILDETTTDIYGKPNDWCWWCWNRFSLSQSFNEGYLKALEDVEKEVNELMHLDTRAENIVHIIDFNKLDSKLEELRKGK